MTDPHSPHDPYAPPEAPVKAPPSDLGAPGSLQQAIEGRYQIQVGEVLREGWERVSGFKGLCFLSFVVIAAVGLAGQVLLGPLFHAEEQMQQGQWATGFALSQLPSLLLMPVTQPLTAGLYVLAIRHASGQQARLADLFSQFDKVVPLVVLGLVSSLLVYVGYALLVLPGLYLAVAMGFTIPLVVDAGLGPWEAITTSVRAVTHRWFTFFGLFVVLGLVCVVSAIPLGVGLLWTVPLSALSVAVAYRRVFGLHALASR